MSNQRILLVEDDLAIRQLLSVILQNENFFTVKASNGKEGLNALEINRNHIDLIISDIMMNDMDGFEFIKAVKANNDFRTIPFIFLSAKKDPQSRILGLRLGADDYITKPFNKDEVSLKVKLLLEKSVSIKKSTITGLSGSLKTMSMKELLQIIGITKRTGTLVIVSPELSGALYFKGGALINAAVGDRWGEPGALELLALIDGDFRFEPGNLANISVAITHSSEELFKLCAAGGQNLQLVQAKHDNNIPGTSGLIVIKKNDAELTGEEIGVFQLVAHNPNITVKEIEQLLGKSATDVISVLVSKGYVGDSDIAEKHNIISSLTHISVSIDTFLTKMKQYQVEHDLYAVHIGLTGSAHNIESFIAGIGSGVTEPPEKIIFDQKSVLSSMTNFNLYQVNINDEILYLHTLSLEPNQQFLWDPIFNATVGVIILKDLDTEREFEHFSDFVDRRNLRHVVYDIVKGDDKTNFNTALALIDKLLG